MYQCIIKTTADIRKIVNTDEPNRSVCPRWVRAPHRKQNIVTTFQRGEEANSKA